MQVQFTVSYGKEGALLSRTTRHFHIPLREDDEDAFQEAVDYFTENLIEVYADEGFTLDEDEDEEEFVGVDFLMAIEVAESFKSRMDANDFLEQLVLDANHVLVDLE